MLPRSRQKIVFKKIPVDVIDRLLGLSEAQLKVWLYHYRREGGGEQRKSYSSRTTCEAITGLKPNTIIKARTWLTRHGWLKEVGRRQTGFQGQPIREYVCFFGNGDRNPSKGDANPPSDDQTMISVTVQRGSQSPLNGDANPPEVDTVQVTPFAALPAIPTEVFRPTNSDGSERVSEQVVDAVSPAADHANENSSRVPRTVEEFWDAAGSIGEDHQAYELMHLFKPVLTDAVVQKHLPAAIQITKLIPEDIDAVQLVKWNRLHRDHKYATKQDKAMYLRSPEQMLKALTSENGNLLNDYETHDFEGCSICQEHCIVHTRTLRAEIAAKREQERREYQKQLAAEAEARRKTEEARLKRESWAAYDFTAPNADTKQSFMKLREFDADHDNWLPEYNVPTEQGMGFPLRLKPVLDATVRFCTGWNEPFSLDEFRDVFDDAYECWIDMHPEAKQPQSATAMYDEL
jgi:hypothetical protein